MSTIYYSAEHVWARVEDDDTVTIGISEYAQGELGDVVYVELPAPGRAVAAGEEIGTIESVKTTSALIAPISGEVTALNNALEDEPELVNSSPRDDGWMLRLRAAPVLSDSGLMDEAAYEEYIESLS